MKVLVTGNAGFIGFHTAARLLQRGDDVVSVDNVNDYYDTGLKEARLAELDKLARNSRGEYGFIRADLADQSVVNDCIATQGFDRVIHLAAQPGVRYSLKNPQAYIQSNIVAFTNILEACRHHKVPHLTYASTSSVYGANTATPYSEQQAAVHPVQLYAATKRANELMAHAYSHLYQLPTTGLRFFTVYGPWGRPDMAFFLFTKNIIEGKEIQVFNHGQHERDFTYIDDIVEGVIRASDQVAEPNADWDSDNPDPATSAAPWRIFNIGHNSPVKLMDYINEIETAIGKKAIIEMLPMQPGDVANTYADTSALDTAVSYQPPTSVKEGIGKFVEWYKNYYNIQ